MDIIAVGIDVSKHSFDAALLKQGTLQHRSFKNTLDGFTAFLKWLSKQPPDQLHLCLEVTGVYGEPLAEYLHDHGLLVSVVNPARVKGFAQSELRRTKTDKQDAGLIARFCASMRPTPWHPQPRDVRELRGLVRRLEALHDMRQQECNRREAAHEMILEQLNRHITFLDDEIRTTKQLIAQHIDRHPDLKNRKRLLASIPGVGEATINVILSEFSDIRQFRNAKALAAFMGVAPKIRQSGTSLRERGMMSKMGRKALRKAFFMPALVALKHNPVLIKLKVKLIAAGKPKMAIVGAAMRKLIHIIYGVLKNNLPFAPHYA